MMDASEEIPHRVFGTNKTASVDGKTEPCCSMAAEASRVLDDDNLLREILVRVGFPTTLVCAALLCKRWYHHASDPAFLRRFRKVNPPRLLGFYVDYGPYSVPTTPCFVPMPLQAPELAAVIRRVASYSFSHHDLVRIENCQNGIISTTLFSYKSGRSEGMHSPLCPERDTFLPLPRIKDRDPVYYQILAREKGDGGLSHFYVCMESARGTTDYTVQVYMLQDGAWCKRTSATTKLTRRSRCEPKAVLVNNKIYVLADLTDIIIMDLTNSSFSTSQLPQGLEYGFSDIVLSRADDSSSVYLIHAKGLQLRIWLHKGDFWFAVDTICLRKLDHSLEDEHIDHVQVSCVGDNAEFVFLRMGRCTFYLDIKSRALRKVHERTDPYMLPANLHPFLMIWPPTFPAFKDDPTRNTM